VTGVADAVHLVTRFFGSLDPRPPSATDTTWAESHLGPGEVLVWRSMSAPDRRHAIGVARRTVDALGDRADRAVVAAALLHDCGKAVSGFGTFARVGATLVIAVVGRSRVIGWSDDGGVRGRLGRYADHPRLGRALLVDAGSAALTSAWAAEHHLPSSAWTVPEPVGAALKAADDD
jgi:hypothetical protein